MLNPTVSYLHVMLASARSPSHGSRKSNSETYTRYTVVVCVVRPRYRVNRLHATPRYSWGIGLHRRLRLSLYSPARIESHLSTTHHPHTNLPELGDSPWLRLTLATEAVVSEIIEIATQGAQVAGIVVVVISVLQWPA